MGLEMMEWAEGQCVQSRAGYRLLLEIAILADERGGLAVPFDKLIANTGLSDVEARRALEDLRLANLVLVSQLGPFMDHYLIGPREANVYPST
jgi:hypothetical protein